MNNQNENLIQNRMVAFCDILGFKNYVKKKGISETYKEVDKLIQDELYKDLEMLTADAESPYELHGKVSEYVGAHWFSDCIILYSKKNEDKNSEWSHVFVIRVASNLLERSNQNPDFRLRCGIGYGRMLIDEEKKYYIGDALIDAYLFEREQEWLGGALTLSAKERVDEMENEFRKNMLVPYEVPLKNGRFIKTYALNVEPFKDIENFEKEIPSKIDVSIQNKYFNSAKFQEHLNSQKRT